MEYIQLFIHNFIDIFVDMAYYIMLGLLFVGILNTYVKRDKVLKHLGTNKFSSVVKASMVGVPLPLCSCGVVPTAVELKKGGASNGAVVSFLISTPQTGVDSIMATYSMMGMVMAIYRPIAAFLSGIIGGAVVNLFGKNEVISVESVPSGSCHCETTAPTSSSCCCSEPVAPTSSSCGCSEPVAPTSSSCGCSEPVAPTSSSCGCSEPVAPTSSSCCCSEPVAPTSSSCGCSEPVAPTSSSCGCSEPVTPTSSSCCSSTPPKNGSKFLAVFRYAYGSFLDDIATHFLLGMVLATLIATFVPADFFVNLGLNQGIFAMIAMVLVGLPMYICSTASIPIALSLMTKGLSLGSAFVFLFTGPVSNIASLVVLRTVLGKKITTMYVGIVVGCSVAFGLLLDVIVDTLQLTIISGSQHMHHGAHTQHFAEGIAVIFAILLCKSMFKNIKSKK